MLADIKAWLKGSQLNKLKRQLKDPYYQYLFDVEPGVFVCFDCETTGLNRKKDRIITLSAIKIVKNEVQTSQSLNLVIKQDNEISAESIEVHQIRNMDVENSEGLYFDEFEAIKVFLEFIRGATLVGYYLEFDVAMVNRVIKPHLGIGLPNPQIEVSGMYYQHAMQNYKRSCIEPNVDLSFDAILKSLEIPNLGQHDAFSDALMTSLIFVKLQQDNKV
ncbi:3'-5' exonuclease [Thiomicrorhabdus lithotrophica]|uniref:3'-5' exonuclease n=1 Tax=Thiomicrorhabdus lithotrophica TaxID=2949997 RepID=A0ABY8CFR6_9GAMM|nr:3'-5' exonuclease [Thiomicrorhabdus lithotrophica]WEJ63637.1 3'-5' exonuclease [Thiomicrorhabdus lithotrophica]